MFCAYDQHAATSNAEYDDLVPGLSTQDGPTGRTEDGASSRAKIERKRARDRVASLAHIARRKERKNKKHALMAQLLQENEALKEVHKSDTVSPCADASILPGVNPELHFDSGYILVRGLFRPEMPFL